jgi:hypothetical protein
MVRATAHERRAMGRVHERRHALRLTDEELEYYGDVYTSSAIREAGVDFEGFLNHPEYYIAKYRRGDGRGPEATGLLGGLRRLLRTWSAPRPSAG